MTQKSDLTIVTGLWNLNREFLPNGFGRSFDHYIECFKRLLNVNYNMVIYLPHELEHIVWESGRTKSNTRIVHKSVSEFDNFPFFKQVQEIRIKPEWRNQAAWIVDSPQSQLPYYNPMNLSKFFMVHDATLFNFFNTDKFIWLDAALSNTVGSPTEWFDDEFEKKITPHLNNKVMFLGFPYDGTVEIHGFTKSKLNEYAGVDTKFVCRAGLFGGSRVAISEMNGLYYAILNESISAGYMGTEESLFTILAHKYKDKCNIQYIDSNGLIVKFLHDLKTEKLPQPKQHPLAWYFLTFNTPRQLEYTVEKWKSAYPKEFSTVKKYVINNSNDPNVAEDYLTLFKQYDMECIKNDGDNIGIHSGRIFAAEHFDKSDHDYYIFIEEDMGVYEKTKDPATCGVGFTTHHEGLFDKAIHIMEDEKLDVLRLTFSEFFGDCLVSWNHVNFPREWKDKVYPPRSEYIESKVYAPNTLNKPKIEYIGSYKGLPYAISAKEGAGYHVSNWPILFNKHSNKLIYLETKWAHPYEAVTMSHAGMLCYDGKIKVGCLLASPILHNRIYHYDGKRRRENFNYTN